jgi:hypothetical protein
MQDRGHETPEVLVPLDVGTSMARYYFEKDWENPKRLARGRFASSGLFRDFSATLRPGTWLQRCEASLRLFLVAE